MALSWVHTYSETTYTAAFKKCKDDLKEAVEHAEVQQEQHDELERQEDFRDRILDALETLEKLSAPEDVYADAPSREETNNKSQVRLPKLSLIEYELSPLTYLNFGPNMVTFMKVIYT